MTHPEIVTLIISTGVVIACAVLALTVSIIRERREFPDVFGPRRKRHKR